MHVSRYEANFLMFCVIPEHLAIFSIAIISPRATTVHSQHSIKLGPIVAIGRLRGTIKWLEMK